MDELKTQFAAQLTHINQSLSKPADTLLVINEQKTQFYRATTHQCIELPVGYQLVADRFFKHTPPTPDDLEYAINYIEDDIEKAIPSIGPIEHLASQLPFLIHIAELAGVPSADKMPLAREKMERLFGFYAEISQGRPPLPSESDVSPVFYAKLLILREYMHHLKQPSITLVAE